MTLVKSQDTVSNPTLKTSSNLHPAQNFQRTAFDPYRDFILTVDLNFSEKIGNEYRTFSTSTTVKNIPSLRSNLLELHQSYANFNSSLATYSSPNKWKGSVGGGRFDIRQGSLLLLVRFSINKEGEILEDDNNFHSVAKILQKIGFVEFHKGNFTIKKQFYQGEKKKEFEVH